MHRMLPMAILCLIPMRAAASIPVVAEPPCFTLTVGIDCAAIIVAEIDRARHSLVVQAYNFTEPRIIAAIVAAHARGVVVTVILDKISPTQACEGADRILAAGIPTWIDRKPRIAHNKVMVIDGATVITGSFNFSTNADLANAENLLVLRSPELAAAYAANAGHRLELSTRWDGRHARPVRACSKVAAANDPT